jgi:PAC2 family
MKALIWLDTAEATLAGDATNTLLVAAFSGWNDAGEAASGAVAQLQRAWNCAPVASIDPEEFFDFSATRPTVELVDGARQISWPTTEVSVGRLPTGRRVVVLTGPEPQLRWRTYCSLVAEVANRCNVTLLVSLGALLADVPHTRPVRVTGTAGSSELATRYGFIASKYEGPTGIVGILNDTFTQQGLDAVSVWAAVPHYLPASVSPRASLALLESLGEFVDAPLSPLELHIEAAEYDRQVREVVDGDDDMARYVAQLEERFDAGETDDDDDEEDDDDDSPGLPADDVLVGGSLTDADGRPISGDALAEELEQFLRGRGPADG